MSEEHRGVPLCKDLRYVNAPRATPKDDPKSAPGTAVRVARFQNSIDRGAERIAKGAR